MIEDDDAEEDVDEIVEAEDVERSGGEGEDERGRARRRRRRRRRHEDERGRPPIPVGEEQAEEPLAAAGRRMSATTEPRGTRRAKTIARPGAPGVARAPRRKTARPPRRRWRRHRDRACRRPTRSKSCRPMRRRRRRWASIRKPEAVEATESVVAIDLRRAGVSASPPATEIETASLPALAGDGMPPLRRADRIYPPAARMRRRARSASEMHARRHAECQRRHRNREPARAVAGECRSRRRAALGCRRSDGDATSPPTRPRRARQCRSPARAPDAAAAHHASPRPSDSLRPRRSKCRRAKRRSAACRRRRHGNGEPAGFRRARSRSPKSPGRGEPIASERSGRPARRRDVCRSLRRSRRAIRSRARKRTGHRPGGDEKAGEPAARLVAAVDPALSRRGERATRRRNSR